MNDDFHLPALVFSGLFFACALLAILIRTFTRGWRASWPNATALLFGFAIIAAFTGATFLYCTRILEISGELLQLPLFLTLLVSGVIAGFVMALATGRVAFFESLCATALFSLIPTLAYESLDVLFTYGTSTAYYAVILLAWYLLLILSLSLGGAVGYLLSGDGHLSFSFSYETWMGRRFLMAKRSSRAVSVITLISTIAVTVGCAGMIIVMSVMNGFSNDLRSKILGANAHLMLNKYGGNGFTNYKEVIALTKNIPNVIGVTPFAFSEVMISSGRHAAGAIIKGIDVASIGKVTTLAENIENGRLDFLDHPSEIPVRGPVKKEHSEKGGSETDRLAEALEQAGRDEDEEPTVPVILPGIIIGREMARSMLVGVGDVLNVVSPIGELGPSGPMPKAKAFRVAGIFYTGKFDYDMSYVFISLTSAQEFFGMKDSVSGIEYKLANADETQTVARQIQALLPERANEHYSTKDWMQMNRPLFSALKLEKIAMFIILLALIFMASLLILVALIMVVIEKGKEIAILKSMGATDSSIMKVFVTYGLIIGAFGAGLGVLLGVGVCGLISKFGIGLDPEIYYITRIPVLVVPLEVAVVTLGAIVISFFATIPPSLYASRLKPVEGLRYE